MSAADAFLYIAYRLVLLALALTVGWRIFEAIQESGRHDRH